MPDEAPKGFRYAAFISYRHVEPDRSVAVWLHRALETYRVPAKLAASVGIPRAIGRAFRDEEELPASADLSHEIENNLQQSRFLVVVCSRRTPESRWIGEEIQRFRDLGRHDRILALLIDGEPGESFPAKLCEIRRRSTGDDRKEHEAVERVEPLAADLRPSRKESQSYLRRMALLRILACVLGCRFDDLRQRDMERRRRRIFAWAAVALCLIAALGFLAANSLKQTRAASGERLAKITTQLAIAARQEARDHRPELAALLARQAFLFGEEIGGGNSRALVDQALREALTIPGFNVELNLPSGLHPLHLAFAADESALIVAAGERTNGTMGGGGVFVWDLKNRKPESVRLAGCNFPVRWVGTGAKNGEVIALTLDQKVYRWRSRSGGSPPQVATATDLMPGSELAVDTEVTRMAGLTSDGLVRMWSAGNRADVTTLDGEVELGKTRRSDRTNTMTLDSIAFSPDGKLLAAAASGPSLRLWNFRAPAPRSVVLSSSPEGRLTSLHFTTDGRQLSALNLGRGEWFVWNVERALQGATDPEVIKLAGDDVTLSQAVSPDGMYVARGGMTRGGITLWNAADTNTPAVRLVGRESAIVNLKFSPQATFLASSSPTEQSVRLWQVRPATDDPRRLSLDHQVYRELARAAEDQPALDLLIPGIHAVAFSPDGKQVVGGSAVLLAGTTSAWLWDLGQPAQSPLPLRSRNGAMSAFLSGKTACTSVQFSSDGKMLAATLGKTVMVWDTRDLAGEPLRLSFPNGLVQVAAFSEKNDWLAAAGEGTDLMLWDIAHDFRATPLPVGQRLVSLAFVPGRNWLATGTDQGDVQLWDLAGRRQIVSHHLHEGPVFSLSSAHNGKLVSGGMDGKFNLVAMDGTKLTPILSRSLGQPVRAVQFLRGENEVAVALGSKRFQGRDVRTPGFKEPIESKGSVLVFDVRPGWRDQQPVRLVESGTGINALAHSPSQALLAIGGDDHGILLINPSTSQLAAAVSRRVWRNLTAEEWKNYVGRSIPYRRTCPELP